MTERRWKFSHINSLLFVGLILVSAAVSAFGADGDLISDSVVKPAAIAQRAT